MSMRNNIVEEFNRTPLTVASTVGSFLLAIAGFLFAWFKPAAITVVESNSLNSGQMPFSISNLFLVLSFFIASSIVGASFTRMLARKHDIGAFIFSIPLAAVTGFLTYVMLNIAPPSQPSPKNLASALDLFFWATLIMYVAFCGKAVARDFVRGPSQGRAGAGSVKDKKEESDRTTAALILIVIALSSWGGMVSYGQKKMIGSFLPEGWQPASLLRIE